MAGGTLAGLSTADGGLTWTATFTQDGTATAPSISVADNTYTDLAGNLGTGASLAGLTSDVVAPTLAITATDLNLGLGESTTVTFTFSEAVTGFDASDVTLAGGTLAGLSTADGGLTWTATFTQDGTATAPSISVADNTYTDLAGNLGTGASLAGLTSDVVAPTLAITATDLNLGLGESTTVTFTFSEAVTGFDASDVTLAGGTLAGLSTADGGLTWTATFTQDGTATAPSISVADNTYTDLAGNLGTGASLAGLTSDVVAPTLAITATDLNLGLGESTTVTFTFSEAVTGFDASDVTLAGGTLAGLSTADGGLTWTATFTQDGTATAPSISVADNTYTDLAGNLGTGASLAGLTSDVVAPTLAITATDLNLGLGESTTVTFTFSEAVTGFDASDVTLAGGTLAGLSTADGGLTWTATFTQDGTATAPSISVADNTYTDLAGNLGTGASLAGLTSDVVAPTLAITATDLNLGLGESTTVTFTFSEAVTGFDASDVTLAGGTLAGLSTADGGLTWTATFTQDGTATAPSISVADNTYTDLAGNLGTGASLAGLTSDVVAPTLAITATDLNLGLGESTTVTFTFSEAVTGFDASDVTLAGGTLAGLSTADGGLTWTATFTQDGTATAPSISVADNTYTDLAGNLGTGASLAGLTSDVVAPTLAITATDLNLGLGESTTVTFTFSEAVTGFDASDVTLAGGTLAGLSTADGGLTWTATFTQDGTATAPSISVADNTYTDLAGNLGTGASLAGLTSDVVAPTLAITATDLNLGLGESTTVTFTFSEAVTGFDASDVTLAGGTLAGLSTADGGLTWTATFTQDGTATAPSISVADNTYTDLAGNLGTGASLAGLTSDVVAPTLAITAADLNLGLGESTTVTFTFSEAVTGFDASDVTLAGGTLAGLSTADGGLTWTATFTQDGTATAPSISVADNTYTDLAGNLGTGASLAGLTSDVVAPTLAITAADLNLGLGESTTVTFTFSEAVTGFDASDVTLAGGTLAGLSTADGGLTWTATFTQDGTATAPSISVADNTYTDLAGNLGTGASLAGLTSDVVAPTLAITAADLNLGLGESTTVTFTFSEAVTGFDASDVTLAGGTLAGLSTADGGLTWTATFTQDGTATAPSISVADNTYTDLAGNLGTGDVLDGTDGFIADIIAPVVGFTNVTTNDDTPPLMGTIDDPTATIVVNVDGLNYSAINNGDGTWTLADNTLPSLIDGPHTVSVIATDPAGNVSIPATGTVTISSSSILAFDNTDIAVLAPQPLLVQDDAALGSNTYLALVSLAGLDLQLGSEAIDFTVGAGQEGNATFTYSALIGVDALSDYSLVVQKFDTATGQWTSVYGGGEADILDLTLLGSTPGVVLEGLEEGQYRAFMTYNGLAGIGLLGTLTGTMDVYDTTQVGGYYTEVADGNVITDINTSGETDVVTATTVVTAVNGQPVTAVDTVINGLYGTLVIDPDGTYTYTPTASAAGVGQTDVFVYTLTDPVTGDTAEANLNIQLSSVKAVDNVVTAEINPEPLLVADDVALGSSTYLAAVSLAGLDLQLLGNDAIEFTVDPNREGTATFTFDAIITADLLSDYAIVVQKFDEATGQWVSIGGTNPEASLIDLTLVGGTPTAVLEGLDAGQYRAFIGYEGLLGVGLGGTLTGTMDVYNPYIVASYSVEPISGNVIKDASLTGEVDAASSSAVISQVNGIAVDPVAGAIITGTYGTLVIDQDGNYTYTPTVDGANLGQVDQFTYTLLDPVTGNTSEATLYVRLDSDSVDMTWNDADPSQPAVITSPLPVDAMDNVASAEIDMVYPVTTEVLDNAISYNWLLGVGGIVIGSKEGTATFTVDPGNLTDAIIAVNFGSVATVVDGLHVVLTRVNPDGTRTVVADSSDTGVIDLLGIFGSEVQFKIDNLSAGTYELFMESNTLLTALGSVTADITLNHGDITQPPVLVVDPVTGNVLADDNSAVYGTNYVPDYITTTSVVTAVTAENGNTTTVVAGTPATVVGVYGTLTINADGTYSYQATADMANVGKVDSFTYTVTDPVTGRTDTATLHVQVGSPDVDVTWNTADPSADATLPTPSVTADTDDATISMEPVVDPAASVASGDLQFAQIGTVPIVGTPIYGTTGTVTSSQFVIGANTVSDVHIQLNYTASLSLSALPTVAYKIQQFVGGVWVDTVYSGSATALAGVLGAPAYSTDVPHLSAGTYQIVFNISALVAIGQVTLDTVITTTATHLDQYTPDGQTDWITGNVLTNDVVEGTQLYVMNSTTGTYELAAGQGVNTGEGTLYLYNDGSYFYKPLDSAANATVDVIDYKLVSVIDGSEYTSSLTINLSQELNSLAVSTAANDTFALGNGSDTLIYNTLTAASVTNATGGNTTAGGVDVWTDFHVGNTATDDQADKIDLSNLLIGSQTNLTIGQYVSVSYDAGTQTATISVDRDGGLLVEGTYTETPLLQLTNLTGPVTLNDLINNGQIIF
ncbi:Ig-like domain-containing protein [Acinetobacter pittii]|nr:BapA/Bap/LapF family large adhesin [Acinetobacter pittii]MDE4038583.1 Ig-like domain-containing protein [Acinetobacter pittii]